MSDDLYGRPDRESIADQIKDLFDELRPTLPGAVAREAIKRGIFPADYLSGFTLRAASEFCRNVLKRKTEEELPYAKPTGGRSTDPWERLDLFTYEQAEALILHEADAWLADYKELRRLVEWCLLKFGRAPKIPRLSEDA